MKSILAILGIIVATTIVEEQTRACGSSSMRDVLLKAKVDFRVHAIYLYPDRTGLSSRRKQRILFSWRPGRLKKTRDFAYLITELAGGHSKRFFWKGDRLVLRASKKLVGTLKDGVITIGSTTYSIRIKQRSNPHPYDALMKWMVEVWQGTKLLAKSDRAMALCSREAVLRLQKRKMTVDGLERRLIKEQVAYYLGWRQLFMPKELPLIVPSAR